MFLINKKIIQSYFLLLLQKDGRTQVTKIIYY